MHIFFIKTWKFLIQVAEQVEQLENICPQLKAIELYELISDCSELFSQHHAGAGDLTTILKLIFLVCKHWQIIRLLLCFLKIVLDEFKQKVE